jgi:hypothetical protein
MAEGYGTSGPGACGPSTGVAVERLAKALWAYEGPPDELWEVVDRGPTRDPVRAKAEVLLAALGDAEPGAATELNPWYARAVQAETLLWALAVWFDPMGHPGAQRDLNLANAHLNRHKLTDADAMRNRLLVLREQHEEARNG